MSTHNVYLPDELGTAAREAGLNLSGLLRAAVEEELMRRKALTHIKAEIHYLPIETAEGIAVTGRITGEFLAEDNYQGGRWYLTSDGRLLWYDEDSMQVSGDLLADPSFDVKQIEDPDVRVVVADRLGLKAVIDL